ncbi:MAG: four helix bundle protein [Candidatus Doudnabacteria bacterium]|nr:four helix bundle protein [Candidatus Doudnabacteria bacterium]
MQEETFHQELKRLMDTYVHLVYRVSRTFPKEEIYGVISQFRRSALSIILNYIEGYARYKDKVHKNLLEIAYGSLKESSYLIEFCFVEKYIPETDYIELSKMADKIGKMLWGTINKL